MLGEVAFWGIENDILILTKSGKAFSEVLLGIEKFLHLLCTQSVNNTVGLIPAIVPPFRNREISRRLSVAPLQWRIPWEASPLTSMVVHF